MRAARVPLVPVVSLGCALAFASAGPGCRCDRDHPYVPYAIDAAVAPPAPVEDAAAAPPADVDAGPFHPREGTVAPPGATSMTVDGLAIAAPPDRVLQVGIAGDFDGDGQRDAAALVAPTPLPGAPVDAAPDPTRTAELFLYRGLAGGALAAPVSAATSPVPLDPACAPRARLAQAGPHTLALEAGATCADHAAARWVAAVVVRRSDAPVHFKATLLDPPGAPSLTIDVDGADRDGDGLDDVTVRASLEGGGPPFDVPPGPRVSALARWFDRPAGMSRDPDEPDASLRALAASAMARAARAKDAPAVPRAMEQVRALYRALCAEGGAPRVVDLVTGRALACGTSRGLEEATLAEVRAYATTGDALRAIAALDRAQVPPAARTASRANDAQGWIAQAAPISPQPSVLRVVGAVPQIERGPSPSWAALAFEPGGKLLVRTPGGVSRFDPETGDEGPAADVPPWPSAVTSPDGAQRWLAAYDPCDGRALLATFGPANGEGTGGSGGNDRVPLGQTDVALPVPPALRPCVAGDKANGAVPALPIAWDARGLWALVAGEPVLVSPDLARAAPAPASLDFVVTPGAPRSPSGRAFVVPTTQGLLVRGAHWRLFRAKELANGWLELRDCVVSDDAARVACVRGGRAFVGIWSGD
jgi:hypothetical protein